MIQLRKKDLNSNKGYTLILVIVAMMFISILALTLLAITSRNLQMMSVDRAGKDNFYDSETIMTEIKTGIGELAGTQAKESYTYVLENYLKIKNNSALYTSVMNEFEVDYLEGVAQRLSGNPHFIWGVEDTTTINYNVDILKNFTRTPSAVSVAGLSGSAIILNRKAVPKTLTIKNIRIEVTTSTGYNTTLTTDVVLKAPNLESDILTEYSKYALVANDKLDVTGGNPINVLGNIYSGIGGFHISNNATFNGNSETFISRGDIALSNGGILNLGGRYAGDQSNIWVENIQTANGSLGATLNMVSNCYVSDDMVLGAKNSIVTLDGNYYGYNYNKENDSTMGSSAQYSSAIMINGLNSTLDMSKVNNLILAGRAFVSRRTDITDATELDEISKAKDILTGESIAIKSDQVAYLVPDKYIVLGHNPVFESEITSSGLGVNDVVVIQSDDIIFKYLVETKPYTEYYFTRGSIKYVYYYLNFRSEKLANDYFKEYYNSNKASVLNKARSYIEDTSTHSKINASLYLLSGHIFNYSKETASLQANFKEANRFNPTNPDSEDLADAVNKATEYKSRQLTLVSGRSTDFRWNTAEGKKEAPLFDTIINTAKVPLDPKQYEFTLSDGSKAYLTIVRSAYEVNDASKRGVVISTEDVLLQKGFEGLILTNKDINIATGGITVKANETMVKEVILQAAALPELKGMFQGVSTSSILASEDDSLLDSISFSNWSKNEE